MTCLRFDDSLVGTQHIILRAREDPLTAACYQKAIADERLIVHALCRCGTLDCLCTAGTAAPPQDTRSELPLAAMFDQQTWGSTTTASSSLDMASSSRGGEVQSTASSQSFIPRAAVSLKDQHTKRPGRTAKTRYKSIADLPLYSPPV
jgi:hypothetical protein